MRKTIYLLASLFLIISACPARAGERPLIRLSISNDDQGNESVFAVIGGSQVGFDPFDTPKKFGSASAEIWFELEDGTKLTSNVIPELPDTGSYALGIRTLVEGEFALCVTEYIDFPEEMKVWLDDMEDEQSILIEEGCKYSFETGVIETAERFRIRFSTAANQADEEATGREENLQIQDARAYSAGNMLFVQTGEAGPSPVKLRIFDLQGRLQHQETLSGTDQYSLTIQPASGIVLVQLESEGRIFREKCLLRSR